VDTQRKPALGFIGLGQMGEPMVRRLLAAGYPVAVWNRSRDKLAPALERGAQAVPSPADLARGADIVMTCVTDQRALEAVLLGPDGVVEGGVPGKLVVDFSSIAPDAARAFALRLERLGMGLVDAPVSGGVPGAEKGSLVVMAGGREEHVERVRPVLAHLASRVTRMGESGAGQATKLCNQIIVGALLPVLAEAVRLAEAAGVDATRLPEALKGGFADSAPLQIFGARMATRRFEPRLAAAALLKKDLENAAALAREHGITLPMVSAAAELYRLLDAQGRVQQDPSVLVELLR
jgi:3-hydroxyisobutyrate dehydrogenase-like beta-hydroxyacid dehydrogenase